MKKNVLDLADVSDYSILQSLGAGWHSCLLLASNGGIVPNVLSAALKQVKGSSTTVSGLNQMYHSSTRTAD